MCNIEVVINISNPRFNNKLADMSNINISLSFVLANQKIHYYQLEGNLDSTNFLQGHVLFAM